MISKETIDPMKCECLNWASEHPMLGNGHHVRCPHYVPPNTKLWKINDCEWVMAPTLKEAVEEAHRLSDVPHDELLDEDTAHELDMAEMCRLKFTREDGDADEKVTFAEEFQRRLSQGIVTQYFATTEF
jgi:hypothetical protein